MARTIRTKVFKFNELNEDAKQKAIESFSDINVDYYWHESVYDDFKELCKTLHIEVDTKKTYFNGFSHQGSGSSFTAWVDVKKCMSAIRDEKWKEYAPLEKLSFYDVTRNMLRIADICTCNIEPSNRESSVKVNFDYTKYSNYETPNVDEVLEEIETFFEDVADTLNNWLYRTLEKEYEYQTSEAAIIETIEANDYEFTADGRQF